MRDEIKTDWLLVFTPVYMFMFGALCYGAGYNEGKEDDMERVAKLMATAATQGAN